MAQTQVALGFPSGANMWIETAIGATVESIKASGGTVYLVVVDNSANGAASYFKMFYTNGAVTLGTTVPDEVLFAGANAKVVIAFAQGKSFPTGMQVACVTAGGTAGTTAPTSSVPASVVYA